MLYNNFYVTNNKILNNVNKCNINKVFEKSNIKVKIFIILMLIVTFLLITILPMITYGQLELLLGAIVFPGIGFSLLFGVLFSKLDFVSKLFAVLFGLGFGGLPWLFITFPIIIQDSFYLTGYVIGVICMLIMGIIFMLYSHIDFKAGNKDSLYKTIHITIPEDLDYSDVFEEIFKDY